jgi:hypothetical protein
MMSSLISREQQHEAAAEMEQRRQRGDARLARHALDEAVDRRHAEARPEGVEVGELLPRHAAQDAERVEQAGRGAVQREIKVVGGVEPGVRKSAIQGSA